LLLWPQTYRSSYVPLQQLLHQQSTAAGNATSTSNKHWPPKTRLALKLASQVAYMPKLARNDKVGRPAGTQYAQRAGSCKGTALPLLQKRAVCA
jgi:hypothetical protein